MESFKSEKGIDFKSLLEPNQNKINLLICDILHCLGIPSHVKGFNFILEGIKIVYFSSVDIKITKDIYPIVAMQYHTTSSRVERNIRHAIEISFIRGDLSFIESIFGSSINMDSSVPTNFEFIYTIAQRIKFSIME